jgi:hypothetical protein
MVASQAASEAIWIRRFLRELKFAQLVAIVVFTDNKGKITFIKILSTIKD